MAAVAAVETSSPGPVEQEARPHMVEGVVAEERCLSRQVLAVSAVLESRVEHPRAEARRPDPSSHSAGPVVLEVRTPQQREATEHSPGGAAVAVVTQPHPVATEEPEPSRSSRISKGDIW